MTVTKQTKHGVIIVDECDADLLARTASRKATRGKCFYACVYGVSKSPIGIHRIITERVIGRKLERSEQVDHINGNGLDNRRINIRVATPSQNNANKGLSKTNTSGFKGVSWHKRQGKWQCRIQVNQVFIYLGTFADPAEAHDAYMRAAVAYFGEFANNGRGDNHAD